MVIRTIREPDIYLTAAEKERLRREWEAAQQYTTMPQSFETWLRGRLAAKQGAALNLIEEDANRQTFDRPVQRRERPPLGTP